MDEGALSSGNSHKKKMKSYFFFKTSFTMQNTDLALPEALVLEKLDTLSNII